MATAENRPKDLRVPVRETVDVHANDFLTVRAFAQSFPNHGTESSLRWIIFNSSLNGLDESGAIVRRGRRVFIVVPRYLAWLAGSGRVAA